MQLKQQKLNISTKAYLIKKDPCVNSNKYEYYDLVQNTPTASKVSVSLRIQTECGKIRTRIAPNTDTFRVVTWNTNSKIRVKKTNVNNKK